MQNTWVAPNDNHLSRLAPHNSLVQARQVKGGSKGMQVPQKHGAGPEAVTNYLTRRREPQYTGKGGKATGC